MKQPMAPFLDTLKMERVWTILNYRYPYPHEHSQHAMIAVFVGLWYVGLVALVAGKRPEILTIIQNCTVISIACYVFYSHCGNRALLRDKSLGRKNPGWVSVPFWKGEEKHTWLSQFVHMHELKDRLCSSWFAPVGSASDYPLLSKWVFYGKLVCSGSCTDPSDEISPIYSLWATFYGCILLIT